MTEEEKKERKREADRRYREKHKEELKARQKEYSRRYVEKNPDKRAESLAKYREKNRELINERNRERYKENSQVFKDRVDKYTSTHKEEIKELHKKYRGKRAEYYKNRISTDPKFRLKARVYTLIRGYLKPRGYTGSKTVWEIVGCDFDTLLEHLQSQFEQGMTLDNHGTGEGKWSIDHVIPISTAQTNEDLERLNHYTNLKPMWSIENIRKGKKTS